MTLTTADGHAALEIKNVMFVDDDHCLLEGLRDALRPYRHRWSMKFLSDAQEALATLDREPHDVVVSDLRMPGMDGASLLEAVHQRHPDVVRIVLSGQAEINMVARAAGAAHRMISKPCATEDLARAIERSCALRKLAARMELDRRAVGASALPTVPRLYAELTDLLSDGNAGATDAARVVERDIAMAAKVLQLANSAYFGRRSPVARVADAVAYLGLEALRALVLQAEVFRAFPVGSPIERFDLDALYGHCGRVARLSAALGSQSQTDKDAFTAGLLHDVGMLVLASHDPAGLAATLASAWEQQRPVYQVERERQGLTHADVGAHLLALWGLPPTVIEAVASHHDEDWQGPFDGGAVVYVADILVRELEVQQTLHSLPIPELDIDYLARVGVADRLPSWRALAAKQFFEGGG